MERCDAKELKKILRKEIRAKKVWILNTVYRRTGTFLNR